MKQGRLGYNSSNDRYGLLASDLWIDTGFHCGEGLEVLVDVITLSIYFAVCSPGRIPGTNAPDFFRLSAVSRGLKTNAV